MSLKAFIYRIVCLVTGERYIGSTNHFRRRVNKHKRELTKGTHPNRNLQERWDKYGEVQFNFAVIEELDGEEERFKREQHWLNTEKPELNIDPVATGSFFRKRRPISEETRQKIRESLRGRPGHKQTPESVAKGAAKRTGQKRTPEQRQRMSEARIGLTFSEEGKQKLRENRKTRSGFTLADETKARLRAAANVQWSDPDYRARHQAATRAAMQDPEVLQRLSDAHKKR